MTEVHLLPFPHPETGESLESLNDFQGALAEIEARLAPLYRVRREIRDEMTDRFDPVLPGARYRTMTQDKVARCPRCRAELEPEEAA